MYGGAGGVACEAATALPHTGTHTNANLLGSRDTNKERTQEHANPDTHTHTASPAQSRVDSHVNVRQFVFVFALH